MSITRISPVHLVVIVHGLWGTPDHVSQLAKSLAKVKPPSDSYLEILCPTSIQWTHTYDGIDFCAERVAQELDKKLLDLESAGKRVTKFSCVGYSLGGLISRFLIGLLHSRTPSFFEKVEPMNFTTFASPWVGMPNNGGVIGSTVHFFGSRTLSRTGNQLYLIDKFSRYPNSPKDSERHPLLALLAHPNTNFYKALLKFKQLTIYANSINDRTVPFVTGAAEKVDGFKISLQRAKKILDRHSGAVESKVPASMLMRLGGMDIALDPKFEALIESSTFIQDPEPLPEILETLDSTSKSSTYYERYLVKLPFFLKPKSYPFRSPLNYLAVAFSPVLVPGFFIYVLSSFLYQSRKSRQRIKLYSVGDLSDDSQRIRRVGLMDELEQEILEDIVGLGNDGNDLESFPNSSHEHNHNQRLHLEAELRKKSKPEGAGPNLEEVDNLLDLGSSSPGHQEGSANEEQSHKGQARVGTKYLVEFNDEEADKEYSNRNSDSRSKKNLTSYEKAIRQSGLSEIQLEMVENINRIPGLVKHFCFFDGIVNSHGAIIYRLEGVSDSRGRLVGKHWSERFLT